MAIEIKMPALSQTTDEVRLVKWLVSEGDTIRKGESLCEVESDKSVMPLESVGSGTVLKRYVAEDTAVAVGSVIAILGVRGEDIECLENKKAGSPKKKPQQPLAEISQSPKVLSEPVAEVRASRLVKNIAAQKNIDLSLLHGTGPGGLITREDLGEYLAHIEKNDPCRQQRTPEAARSPEPEVETLELTHQQLAVARNLGRSKAEIPHFYLKTEAEVDGLLGWRERHTLADQQKISFYTMLAHAVSKALRRVPAVNASYKDDRVLLHRAIHIGLAVAAGTELYVPVIPDVDMKVIAELDGEVKRLVAKARAGKLEASEQAGATITLTNLGMYLVDEFYPIISPPQAAVLGFGRTRRVLRVGDDDSTQIRSVLTVTGSFDHRIVNGAQAAEFLGQLKRALEEEW